MGRAKKREREKVVARCAWASDSTVVEQWLSREDADAWRDRWRRVYAAPTKRATGRWANGGYDWHGFSYEYAASISLERAKAAYGDLEPGRFIVLPDGASKREVFGVVGLGVLPMLSYSDNLVFPPDLAWTMAFTHEDDWLGPYFSRREWIVE